MTEDKNSDRWSDQPTEQYSRATESPEREAGPNEQQGPFTQADWEAIPSDPDLVRSLGYDIAEWEEFETQDGSGQVMFLPGEEEQIRNDAFVVADSESVVDLAGKR